MADEKKSPNNKSIKGIQEYKASSASRKDTMREKMLINAQRLSEELASQASEKKEDSTHGIHLDNYEHLTIQPITKLLDEILRLVRRIDRKLNQKGKN